MIGILIQVLVCMCWFAIHANADRSLVIHRNTRVQEREGVILRFLDRKFDVSVLIIDEFQEVVLFRSPNFDESVIHVS